MEVSPESVRRVYGQFPADSWLRELIRASLGTISHPPGGMKEMEMNRWLKVIYQHADFGRDWHQCRMRGWVGPKASTGGACRFHEHGHREVGVDGKNDGGGTEQSSCPWQDLECFPDGDTVGMVVSKAKKRAKAVEGGSGFQEEHVMEREAVEPVEAMEQGAG